MNLTPILKIEWVLCLVGIGVLWGCKTQEKENSPTAPAQLEEVVSQEQTADDKRESIEIFTWWKGVGEEKPFLAFMEEFDKQFPAIRIDDLSKIPGTGENAHNELMQRMKQNRPPDSFQVYPVLLFRFLGEKNLQIEPLDALYTLKHWNMKFPKEVLDTLSHNGHIYAVPIGIHRRNTIFANPELVPSVPVDLKELLSAAKQLKQDGVDPLVVTIKNATWPLMLMFNVVMAGSAGATFLKEFYEKKLDFKNAQTLSKMKKAVDDFAEILTYTNSDGKELDWRQGAKRVMDKKAAMYIHGDWVSGYYRALEWESKVGPAPGTQGLFVVSVDAFTLCKNAPHPQNARRFLSAVGSPEGQSAFNRLKGSLPVHKDVSVKGWGEIAERTYDAFHSAAHIINMDGYTFIGFPEELSALYHKKITPDDLFNWITANIENELVRYDSTKLLDIE